MLLQNILKITVTFTVHCFCDESQAGKINQ